MANLMLTTACNLKCSYCFGKEIIGAGHPQRMMSMSTFTQLLDWIERSDQPNITVQLMGGEPTLHPHFEEILCELYRRKRHCFIFTNLSAPLNHSVLEKIMQHDAVCIVNVNSPSDYSNGQFENLQQHLEILGASALLTLNITGPSTPYESILDYYDRFGLNRALKIGVALPTLNLRNIYVKRDQYAKVAAHIMNLVDDACRRGISVGFECGVPYCLFNAKQREKLTNIQISHCGSRLDITPTGEIINCLPLCKIASIPFTRFHHYLQALHWFRDAFAIYQSIGSTEACLSCDSLAQGLCMACLAHTLRQLNQIALPPLPGEEKGWTISLSSLLSQGKTT